MIPKYIKKTVSLLLCLLLMSTAAVFAACATEDVPIDEKPGASTDDEINDGEDSGWPGNAEQYSVASTPTLADSPLQGLNIYWLGSSVTYGAEGEGVSDFIDKRHGCTSVKEAVPGTTLRTSAGRTDSYVERLESGKLMPDGKPDLFVCQLSTNDADNKTSLLGQPTADEVRDRSAFDVSTTCGAIEYIISYASDTWDCPVAFWSNPKASSVYGKLVDRMRVIAEKWDILLWNLYDDVPLPTEGSDEAKLYMTDRIHPTKAGYRDWWMPYFEAKIAESLALPKP